MSQKLTLQLSNPVFEAVRQRAESARLSPAQWVAGVLEAQLIGSRDVDVPEPEAEQQHARARFERHLGALDLGQATGVDNEQIDADLTKAYANTHP